MGLLGDSAVERADDLSVAGRRLSRGELLAAAAAVGDRVAGADRVAVNADATLETVVAVVGCLLAGVPFVPLPPGAGPAYGAHLVADSGCSLVLNAADPVGRAEPVPVEPARRSGSTWPEPAEAATACVLYTSGTTGPPKGVVLSRASLAWNLDALAEAWDWTADDTLAHGLPLFHLHGLGLGVIGALRRGSRLVHTGTPTPESYAAAGATLLFGVPTVWSRVVAAPAHARALRGARLLVSGSAALPAGVHSALAALAGQPPVERYGMTETLITLSQRAAGDRAAGTVGLPLHGVSTRVVDEGGAALPPDGVSVGELQVRGGLFFDGYLGLPEATAAIRGDDGWVRTGDAASVDPAGRHRVVGRLSLDLVKTAGYRVGAGEVEDVLVAHPAVREAAVVGVPDDDLGQRLVAVCVGDPTAEAAVAAHCAGALPRYKCPRDYRWLDALPRNAMGKVVKAELLRG